MNERYPIKDLPHSPFLSEDEYFAAFVALVPTPNEYKDEVDYKTVMGGWNDFVMLGFKIDNADNRLDYIIACEVLAKLFTKWTERSMISTGDYPPGHPGSIFLKSKFLQSTPLYVDPLP